MPRPFRSSPSYLLSLLVYSHFCVSLLKNTLSHLCATDGYISAPSITVPYPYHSRARKTLKVVESSMS